MRSVESVWLKMQKNILIIEDEISLCDILNEELTAEGYKVHVAHNGVEGIEKMRSVEPDAVLCDRAMPAMTGSELLERIRGVYPQYRDIPFIFMTALTTNEDKQAVSDLEPAAYLEKPIDFRVLKETLNSVLNH